MEEALCTKEIQAHQSLLKKFGCQRSLDLKFEENQLLMKLLDAIEEEEQTYLFSNAQLSEGIKTDFFIISRSARLIITIAMDEEKSKKLKSKLGETLSECNLETDYKWRHLNVLYEKERLGCACCRLGLIGPNSNISRWWKNVIETSWKSKDSINDGFGPLLKCVAKNIFHKRKQATHEKPFFSGEELFCNSLFL